MESWNFADSAEDSRLGALCSFIDELFLFPNYVVKELFISNLLIKYKLVIAFESMFVDDKITM